MWYNAKCRIISSKTSVKRCKMAVSYKKLWKMLIDKDMKKKDLAVLAELSSYMITNIECS